MSVLFCSCIHVHIPQEEPAYQPETVDLNALNNRKATQSSACCS
jgi:hypothetical protein